MRTLLALCLASAAFAQGRDLAGVKIEKDIEYGVASDTSLTLDIYRPDPAPQEAMAAIVWIHGGGWKTGDKNNSVNALAAARKGYFAVSINYRLSGEAPFPAAVEDCKCAIRWLRSSAKKLGVDPERIGVWGSSAGGHLALMVGCADGEAGLEGNGGYAGVSSGVQAVCSWFGPSKLEAFDGGGAGAVAAFLKGAKDEAEAAKLASPVTHASKDDPPVLMVHGDQDKTVPLSQSEKMLKAMTEAGGVAELVVVKGAGHGWRGGDVAPSADEIQVKCFEFFDKELRGGGRQGD